jgi:hypothetical protein
MTDASIEIKIAVNLNNQAVDLIMVDQNYEEAMLLLETALHIPRRIMSQADHHKGFSCEATNISLDECMHQSPPLDDKMSDGDSVFVYRRGIYVPANIQRNFHSSVLVSVAVTFNLALAHHLAASNLSQSNKRDRLLNKATKLYELAHNLHSCGDLDSISFTLACVNNLGVIHDDLRDHETAEKCFWHLLSTLMFVVDSRDTRDNEASAVNGNGLDGFLRNATERLIEHSTAAAA